MSSVTSCSSQISSGNIDHCSDYFRCLIPLLDALGWRGEDAHLLDALPHMPEQLGLGEMLNTLANLRFASHTLPARLDWVDKRLMPCLFVPEHGSTKVLIKQHGAEILSFDGGDGSYGQISPAPIRGEVVVFQTVRAENASLLTQQKNWFSQVISRFRVLFFAALILTFILSLLALVAPVFVMTIYDQVITAGSNHTMGYFLVGALIYVIGELGFKALRGHLFHFISVRLGNIVGNEIFRRILHLPLGYTEHATLGSQVARIRDFETVREFFSGQAVIALFELPFVLLLLAALFILGGSTALVPSATIVLFLAFGAVAIPWMQRINAHAATVGARKQELVMEILTHLRAIKYTGGIRLWLKRYEEISAESAITSFKASYFNSVVNSLAHILVTLGGLGTMVVGVWNVMAGSMSLGALMACMMLVWRILAPLRNGFSVITQVGRIHKSIAQIDRLMNVPLEKQVEATTTVSRALQGNLSFRQVSIRYAPDAYPALIGVNLDVNHGETLVIIGHDGAGKSTILKLIMGLYRPQAGKILVDHLNIQQIDPAGLRNAIAYAPQSNQFFYGTIAQNLRLSKPTAMHDELESVTRDARVYDDIMALKEGFETRIGDHNIKRFPTSFLKRLNMARAFLRPSSILLLDEPESGLGPDDESAFLETLLRKKGMITQVITTHRSSYFHVADKAIWLDQGRVRMAGTAANVANAYRRSKINKEHQAA